VALDPKYSAAWKLLGRALVESGQPIDALVAYREGIAVAEAKGDKQAAKEMVVYARRIEKSATSGVD
jgi:cytochrome c-type biogenesis protein CcmH/NrfG